VQLERIVSFPSSIKLSETPKRVAPKAQRGRLCQKAANQRHSDTLAFWHGRWLASRRLLPGLYFGQGIHIATARLDWHGDKLLGSRPVLQRGRILLFPDPGLKRCFLGLE